MGTLMIVLVLAVSLLISSASGIGNSSCSFEGLDNNIIYGNLNTLFMTDLGSLKTKSFAVNANGIQYADYHYTEGSIYWSDLNNKSISRIRCYSSAVAQQNVIIQLNRDSTPFGVAVDTTNNHLYWIEQTTSSTGVITGAIQRSDLDGSNKAVILSSLQKPIVLAIDTRNQWLYFSDHGSRTIEKCKLDGSSKQALITQNILTPYGLALDFSENRIYWTDAAKYHIQSAKLDGTDIRDVTVSVPQGLPIIVMGLDLDASFLYVANLNTGVYKIAKNQDMAVPVQLVEQNFVYGVKLLKQVTTNGSSAKPVREIFGIVFLTELLIFGLLRI